MITCNATHTTQIWVRVRVKAFAGLLQFKEYLLYMYLCYIDMTIKSSTCM